MSNLFDRESILMSISDASKEAYGFRVRRNYAAMSDEELLDTYNGYCRDITIAIAEEKEREEAAYYAWEAHLSKLMDRYGVSRCDAIRWDMEAEGAEGDASYYCFLVGIDYSHARAIEAALA